MTIEIARNGVMSDAAAIFNSAVAAAAIAAAWELGALTELNAARKLDAEEFALRKGLDTASTVGLFRALAAVGVVTRDGPVVTVADGFADVYHNKSFFHWLSRGSADLFREMPTIMRRENRTGDFYGRDHAAIAYACREIDEITYAPTFWSVLDGLRPVTGRIADLGCGGGARLLEMLRRYPGTRGVGVDLAPAAVRVATENLAAAGLGDRAEFFRGDVLALDPRSEYAEVELATCFMMGHDFWPRESCIATLRRLREVFPNARRLVLGDATRSVDVPDTELPVFTLGFELGHDLMGTFIPTLADWESVFDETGWKLLRLHRIDVVVGEVIFELG